MIWAADLGGRTTPRSAASAPPLIQSTVYSTLWVDTDRNGIEREMDSEADVSRYHTFSDAVKSASRSSSLYTLINHVDR